MKNRGLTAAMNAAAFAAERGGAALVVVACGTVCSLSLAWSVLCISSVHCNIPGARHVSSFVSHGLKHTCHYITMPWRCLHCLTQAYSLATLLPCGETQTCCSLLYTLHCGSISALTAAYSYNGCKEMPVSSWANLPYHRCICSSWIFFALDASHCLHLLGRWDGKRRLSMTKTGAIDDISCGPVASLTHWPAKN